MASANTPARRKRENQFFDVGVQGRKTGITLPENTRDEFGIEDIDGIFSSPEKPDHEPNQQNGDKTLSSEEMQVAQSPVPDPVEVLSSRRLLRSTKTTLPPPPGRSPVKTNIGSSPRRRSSVAPPSRALNESPRRPVARKLDFQSSGTRLSIQKPPIRSPAKNKSPTPDVDDFIPIDDPSPDTTRYQEHNHDETLGQTHVEDQEEPEMEQADEADDSVQLIGEEDLDLLPEEFPGYQEDEDNDLADPDHEEDEEHPPSSPIIEKRKRGRKRLSGSSVANGSAKRDPPARGIAAEAAPTKRRGRPRKSDSVVIGVNDDEATQESSIIEPESEQPKARKPTKKSHGAAANVKNTTSGAARGSKTTKSKGSKALNGLRTVSRSDADPVSAQRVKSSSKPFSQPNARNKFQTHEENEPEPPMYGVDDYSSYQQGMDDDESIEQSIEVPAASSPRQRKRGNLHVHEDDDAVSMGPPPKRSKTSKAGPKERDPNARIRPSPPAGDGKMGLWDQQFKKPVPRSLQILHEHTPWDESQTVTRSGRRSVKPLEYWNGEVIQRAHDGTMLNIVRAESVDAPKPTKKKGSRGPGRSKTPVMSAITEEGQDLEDWEEEGQVVTGVVKGWDQEYQATLEEEEEDFEIDVAFSVNSIETRDVVGADFRYNKILSLPFFGGGMVEIPPGGYKRTKNSRKMHMLFFVATGKVDVNVSDNAFTISKGGVWQVPRGNNYSIENPSTAPAKIFFAQGCEVEHEIG